MEKILKIKETKTETFEKKSAFYYVFLNGVDLF